MRGREQNGRHTESKRLECVLEHIRVNLNEPPDYRRLAKLANISYCQLFREFKRCLGVSPQQYIEHQRIRGSQGSRLDIRQFVHTSFHQTPSGWDAPQACLEASHGSPACFSTTFTFASIVTQCTPCRRAGCSRLTFPTQAFARSRKVRDPTLIRTPGVLQKSRAARCRARSHGASRQKRQCVKVVP